MGAQIKNLMLEFIKQVLPEIRPRAGLTLRVDSEVVQGLGWESGQALEMFRVEGGGLLFRLPVPEQPVQEKPARRAGRGAAARPQNDSLVGHGPDLEAAAEPSAAPRLYSDIAHERRTLHHRLSGEWLERALAEPVEGPRIRMQPLSGRQDIDPSRVNIPFPTLADEATAFSALHGERRFSMRYDNTPIEGLRRAVAEFVTQVTALQSDNMRVRNERPLLSALMHGAPLRAVFSRGWEYVTGILRGLCAEGIEIQQRADRLEVSPAHGLGALLSAAFGQRVTIQEGAAPEDTRILFHVGSEYEPTPCLSGERSLELMEDVKAICEALAADVRLMRMFNEVRQDFLTRRDSMRNPMYVPSMRYPYRVADAAEGREPHEVSMGEST